MSGEIPTRSGHTITSNIVNGGRVHFGDHFESITYSIEFDDRTLSVETILISCCFEIIIYCLLSLIAC